MIIVPKSLMMTVITAMEDNDPDQYGSFMTQKTHRNHSNHYYNFSGQLLMAKKWNTYLDPNCKMIDRIWLKKRQGRKQEKENGPIVDAEEEKK